MYSKAIKTLITLTSFALVVLLTAPSPSGQNHEPPKEETKSTELSPEEANEILDMLEALREQEEQNRPNVSTNLSKAKHTFHWRVQNLDPAYHTL